MFIQVVICRHDFLTMIIKLFETSKSVYDCITWIDLSAFRTYAYFSMWFPPLDQQYWVLQTLLTVKTTLKYPLFIWLKESWISTDLPKYLVSRQNNDSYFPWLQILTFWGLEESPGKQFYWSVLIERSLCF